MDLEHAIQSAVKRLEAEEADAFEVVGLSENSLFIEARRQMVSSFRRNSGRGIAIRIVKDGRMGWSATTNLEHKAVVRAVSHAIASLGVTAETEEAVILAPQDPKGDFVEHVGRSLCEISDDEKIKTALSIESTAIAADNRVTKVRCPRYEERVRHLVVVNSKGVSVSARRGLVSCALQAVASDESGSESAYEFEFSPRFEDLDVEGCALRAARRAVTKLGAMGIGGASLPAVFENRAASSMVGLLAPSFFADNVQRGKSAIANRLGERAYRDKVTIVDDGLLSGGFNSFPFDGEGIPQRKTTMVDRGSVAAWLYDGPRSFRDKVLSTGNCSRRELGRLPAIGVTNCYLAAGDLKAGDLMSGIKRGILISDLLGVHTANPISGDFSLGIEGFLIENGEKTSPIRGVTIAGNIHSLFGRIVEIADDLKFFGSHGSPSFLVEELMFSG